MVWVVLSSFRDRETEAHSQEEEVAELGFEPGGRTLYLHTVVLFMELTVQDAEHGKLEGAA
jgi:hypothetical protein